MRDDGTFPFQFTLNWILRFNTYIHIYSLSITQYKWLDEKVKEKTRTIRKV